MKHRAFTLIEVLVALAILSVGLIPAFYHVTGAVLLAGRIRDSLITANLAQEGIEVVRATRDANWFSDQPYTSGLDGCALGCRVQYDSGTDVDGDGSPDTPPTLPAAGVPLDLDPVTGLYQYGNGEPSPYTRTITIVPDAGGLRVDSTVTWKYRGQDRIITVRTYLYDWLK